MSKTKLQSGKIQFLILFIILFSIQVFAVDNFAGNALDFDGSDDHVLITSTPELRPANNFTIEAWIKPNDIITKQIILMHDENGGGDDGSGLSIVDSVVTFSAHNGTSQYITSDEMLTPDIWNHIAGVYDSSVLKVYVNGVEKILAGSGDVVYSVTDFVNIGRRGGTLYPNTLFYTGQMDELRFWNIPRTQTEIADNMHHTLEGTETGLVSYWQFNEPSGIIASDAVGINNGLLINMTDDDWIISTAPVLEGSGTSGDPYLISTLDELRLLSENSYFWNDHFIQTADIDASATSTWNGGEGFIPIGNDSTIFMGTYNGQNHIIDGLYINRPSSNLQGLFGRTSSSTIENLGVTNIDVSGEAYTGGLVGWNAYSSSISNCYSTGSVSGGGWNIGGLVGFNESSISNCYCTVSVSGYDRTGGLVGNNEYSSNISNCYSTGSVSGSFYTGGLVGWNAFSSSISNCYSTGSVSGVDYTGGLVGYNFDATTSNSFWDTETSGQTTSAGGTGKTTVEMKTESTYTDAGWDFIVETANGTNDYWFIDSSYNNGYPILIWQVGAIADFTASPLEVFIGTEIQFIDNSFASPTEWQWDFENDGNYDSTEQNPVHIYSTTGNYSVKLTATNEYSTDSYIRTDYIYVNNTFLAPQNVQITISGDDAVISWDAVTHDIDGIPINLDGYIVKFCENGEDFSFLHFVEQTNYIHLYVTLHASQMFYQVLSYKSYSTRELEYLKELNNSKEKIKWSEVKRNLERIK